MVDGSKCTASGAGIGGGTACAPAKFTVITADASGERVRAGGAKVVVTVTSASVKSSSSDAETPGVVVHDPVDHGDGTYACVYVVPRRGDYSVGVVVNDHPIEGSPFPVFFAGAKPGAEPTRFSGSSTFPTPSPGDARDSPHLPTTQIPIPTSVIVKNLGTGIGVEHLRATFSVCGAVIDARVAGSGGQFAFVEFAANAEATAALKLSGMILGDRAIKVEMARTPKRVPSSAFITNTNPNGTMRAMGLGAGAQKTDRAFEPPTFEGKPLPPPPPRRDAELKIESETHVRLPDPPNADAAGVAARRAAEISAKLGRGGGDGDASRGGGRSPRRSKSRSRSRSRSRE
jgi:hypothetical protein